MGKFSMSSFPQTSTSAKDSTTVDAKASPSERNSALTAYRLFCLSRRKLGHEEARQTPDLHRLVAHALMLDNIRRWSREPTTKAAQTVDEWELDDLDTVNESCGRETDLVNTKGRVEYCASSVRAEEQPSRYCSERPGSECIVVVKTTEIDDDDDDDDDDRAKD